VLLEKTHISVGLRFFVRFFALGFLVVGISLFVANIAQFPIKESRFSGLFFGLLLAFSGFLLIRLRSRGLIIFALLVFFVHIHAFLDNPIALRPIDLEPINFWPHFFVPFLLLLILCLLYPCYFFLRRGEGRRPHLLAYFFGIFLTISLTVSSFAAYYEGAFCGFTPMPEIYPLGQNFNVSLPVPVNQWLPFLPCSHGGDL